jgi:hypothetical protein
METILNNPIIRKFGRDVLVAAVAAATLFLAPDVSSVPDATGPVMAGGVPIALLVYRLLRAYLQKSGEPL